MDKIKKKFSKYGLAEWLLIIIGFVALSIQLFKYATNTLGEWTLEIAVCLIAFLFMRYPLLLADIVRKARGISPRKDN